MGAGMLPNRTVIALLAGLAATAWSIVGAALPASTRLTNGFAAYYTAARLLHEGQPVARFYDDAWFRDQTIRLGFDRAQDVFNTNPPAALLLWPIATLPPIDAKITCTIFNLVCLALAALVLVATATEKRRRRSLAVVLLLVGLFEPVAEEIRLGQAYALLLLAEVAFFAAYTRKRDALAGLPLGGMIALKTAGLALPLLLVAQRRWRALAYAGLAVVLVVVLTSALLGANAWVAYAEALTSGSAHGEIAVTAYQSVPGLVTHLFRFDPTWNRHPLVDVPGLVVPLDGLLAIALVGMTAWRSSHADSGGVGSASAVAAWVMLSIVLSPPAADYHYTLAILPAFLLLEPRLGEPDCRLGLAIVLAGIVLIGAPWPGRLFATGDGIAALVAYPRLYGGLLLWGVAVFGGNANPSAVSPELTRHKSVPAINEHRLGFPSP
jgi:hypothetical protein